MTTALGCEALQKERVPEVIKSLTEKKKKRSSYY